MYTQAFSDDGRNFIRRYEYDDREVYAIDLGENDGNTSVDVVDRTAIIVTQYSNGTSKQMEFELPARDAQAFIKNGVLTIEVER